MLNYSSAVTAVVPSVAVPDNLFLQDVLQGLGEPQKRLSPKYFYDAEGSHLFNQICELEEYYPYRTELAMLPGVAADLREFFAGHQQKGLGVVEFGAGSLHKIRLLIDGIPFLNRYIPVDICGEHLRMASQGLSRRYPQVKVTPIEADFTGYVTLPERSTRLLGFFPGSTIGNMLPDEAIHFMHHMRDSMGMGSHLLIGVDTKKDTRILHWAYNDQAGITARFNKNILKRINRELDGNFDIGCFKHEAWYNKSLGRIEMHLRSKVAQTVTVAGEHFFFCEDETIHTENSYKYHPEEFARLAAMSGWGTVKRWAAADDMFSMFLLTAR
ncbi:L-histidine N(alpha)-methyltransferase [Cellvibrio polysaccharolyticus]|uniref:L-histidine N(Alpha)-methyltransferase n=1 Tax=Cellvibrio polysaccharolyticus TaxID=2082724 RepID=A0A928YTQ3_9GAMM|nr:L-histidine N(alpha)-methyltransferase [Cellvibrio polysaccharolyticus]MBE8717254.1 L-histidine N(alpha)-methyltransferase [Cellvibrio polysaccharolyticus]